MSPTAVGAPGLLLQLPDPSPGPCWMPSSPWAHTARIGTSCLLASACAVTRLEATSFREPSWMPPGTQALRWVVPPAPCPPGFAGTRHSSPARAPSTDLPDPVGSPQGSRGWMRSYCSSDPGSRSVTRTKRQGHQSGAGLWSAAPPALHPMSPGAHRGQRLPKGISRAAGSSPTGACGEGEREGRLSPGGAALMPQPGTGQPDSGLVST